MFYTNTSPPLYTTLVKLPSLRGSLVPCRTLQPHCPCFMRFYTVSYGVRLRVLQAGGDVLCFIQTRLPPLRLWSSCPPCEVVLFLVIHSSPVVPVLRGFYTVTVFKSVKLGVTQVGEDCVVFTQTLLPSLRLLRGSLVLRCTLQPRSPSFSRLYTMSYSMKLGVSWFWRRLCCVHTKHFSPPL